MWAALNALNGLKRKLDEETIDSFFGAADERHKHMKPRNRDEIIELVTRSNTYRWWRLKHDYKWLQKQMKKHGYNPDEARELL
jgi:hypothetical protein